MSGSPQSLKPEPVISTANRSRNKSEKRLIPLSSSVNDAEKKLTSQKEISAWDFVSYLLKKHPYYAENLAGQLYTAEGPIPGNKFLVKDWINQLQMLFNPDKVKELHGKLAILGLCILDKRLKEYLDKNGLFKGISKELNENFNSLLVNTDQISEPEQVVPHSQRNDTQGLTLAGYISDSVESEAEDHLSIDEEVRNIAHVVMSRRVQPPLSLGLFGDWGSGKSFFMAKLRKEISAISNYYQNEEEKTGNTLDWCTRVIQIEFNAWHFSDTNLWASFVTRIYEFLQQELSDKAPSDILLRERLIQEVKLKEGILHESEEQLQIAESRVTSAADTLEKVQEDVNNYSNKLQGLISDVGTLLQEDKEIQKELSTAAQELGFPEAAKTYIALEDLNKYLQSFSSRLGAIFTIVIKSPLALISLASLVIILPVTIAWLIEYFEVEIGLAGKSIAEIASFTLGLVAWLKGQVSKGMNVISAIEKGLTRAQEVRKTKIEENQNVKLAKQNLLKAKGAETAALYNLQQAQNELQRLKTELHELKPERKLYRLIEERSQSATYSKHLGIISLIRTDFERMSALLTDLAHEKRDLTKEPPPIQRIVLYIDDLDRCRPERVVEVLEAIHLLLAFPLFTVVVGVDPRWLRYSLSKNYPFTLSGDKPDSKINTFDAKCSTPQDYLEKIFQIPFALKPVEKQGYQQLVTNLLKPLDNHEIFTRDVINNSLLNSEIIAGTSVKTDINNSNKLSSTETIQTNSNRLQVSQFKPLDAKQLEFSAWEAQDINQLWPLFRTPRTIKRFINTYRLLRAGVTKGLDKFVGTSENKGQYQIALMLLAVVTSNPNETEVFLQKIGELLNIKKASPDPSFPLEWKKILENMVDKKESKAWQELISDLIKVTENDFERKFDKTELQYWALRVSRYSFSIRPDEVLN